MSEFEVYFGLGRDHILDYKNGYDHILFVTALCAVYQWSDWKRVLILITAFTVGHSVTLALATLQIISVPADWVEFLIPVTIFITAFSNIFKGEGASTSGTAVQLNYLYALFFGLIHGMGFSNYLRAILGKDRSIVNQLFAFNVGLEFGQIIIVVIFLTLVFIAVKLFKVNRRDWRLVLSALIAGMALVLVHEKFNALIE
jgi:hypothetical protein